MSPSITPAMENYLEGILIVRNKRRKVRVKDLATLLNVKASSATEALAILESKGLVIHEKYGHVDLTPQGLRRAERLYSRHCALKDFFTDLLGVEPGIAEDDACKIEHYLSRQTMNRVVAFMDFARHESGEFHRWLGKYRESATRTKRTKRESRSREA